MMPSRSRAFKFPAAMRCLMMRNSAYRWSREDGAAADKRISRRRSKAGSHRWARSARRSWLPSAQAALFASTWTVSRLIVSIIMATYHAPGDDRAPTGERALFRCKPHLVNEVLGRRRHDWQALASARCSSFGMRLQGGDKANTCEGRAMGRVTSPSSRPPKYQMVHFGKIASAWRVNRTISAQQQLRLLRFILNRAR